MEKKDRLAIKPFVKIDTKARIVDAILIVFFGVVVFVTAMIAMINIKANADDDVTKVTSTEMFENIDMTRLVVMKKDATSLSEEDRNKLKSVKHVVSVERYDPVSEINYFCKKGDDYTNDVYNMGGDTADDFQAKIVLVKRDKFMRSASCLDEKMLSAGRLPVASNEIVIYSDSKEDIGKSINYYISDQSIMPEDAYIAIKMNVVGILNEPNENTYFSDILCRSLAFTNQYKNYYVAALSDPLTYRPGIKLNWVSMRLIYPDNGMCSGDDAIFEKDRDVFFKEYKDFYLFPLLEGIDTVEEAVDYIKAETIAKITNDEEKINPSHYVHEALAISDDNMRILTKNYEELQNTIYIENYAYVDDVLSDIKGLGYEAISPYKISTLTFDFEKTRQRVLTLIVSVLVFIAIILVYLVMVRIILTFRKKQSMVYFAIGMKTDELLRFQFQEVAYLEAVGIALGVIITIVLKLFSPAFFKGSMEHFRIYQMFIVALLHFVAASIALLGFYGNLKRQVKKGIALG